MVLWPFGVLFHHLFTQLYICVVEDLRSMGSELRDTDRKSKGRETDRVGFGIFMGFVEM